MGFGMVILITLLVIVVTVVFFRPVVIFAIDFIRSGGDASACALSLYKGKGVAKCPIDDVKIFDDWVGIQYGGKEYKGKDKEDYDEFLPKGSRNTNDMADEALARLLRACLQKGGGLNSQSFSEKKGYGESYVCLECTELIFDESAFDESVGGSIAGDLKGYLERTVPTQAISDKTYMEILTIDREYANAYTAIGKENNLLPGATIDFAPDKRYAIFYIGIKPGSGWDPFNAIQDIWNVLTVDVGHFVNWDKGGVYFTFITEASNYGKICELEVN